MTIPKGFCVYDKKENKILTSAQAQAEGIFMLPVGMIARSTGINERGALIAFEMLPNMIPLYYSGIKDENGTELYEGDLLEIDEITRFGSAWKTHAAIMWNPYDNRLGIMSPHVANGEQGENVASCRKIGNLFVSPELFDKFFKTDAKK